MKTFINKQTEIKQSNEEGEVVKISFSDLAKMTLNITPKEGWVMKEMKSRFKLEDKFNGHEIDAVIELEDAEAEMLNSLAQIPWAFKHKDIIAYVEHIEDLMKN